MGRDRLEWVLLKNRPLLRCLHGLALTKYDADEVEETLRLFQELLSPNPSDIMPETLDGRALALFKLGRWQEASTALHEAIEYLPLAGKELLKTKHHLPKTARLDGVAVGGADEAYYYWEESGQLWEEDAEALQWLRETMKQVAWQDPTR